MNFENRKSENHLLELSAFLPQAQYRNSQAISETLPIKGTAGDLVSVLLIRTCQVEEDSDVVGIILLVGR